SIGIIGILLPFTVAFGKILLESPGILGSISAYYYSLMGNVFVGSLCAIGVFLSSYRGYDWRDVLSGHLAAVFALGRALFPTAQESAATAEQLRISGFHAAFAGGFFLTLAYFSLFLFRMTNENGAMTRKKKMRNAVFLVCGSVILAAVILIALTHVLPAD